MEQRTARHHRPKQRRRPESPRPGNKDTAFDSPDSDAGANHAAVLLSRVLRLLMSGLEPVLERRDFGYCAERHQQAAIDAQLTFAVRQVIGAGWTPLDLYEVVRRRSASSAITHVLDVVAATTDEHPTHLVHPRWRDQLDTFGAREPEGGGLSPSFSWSCRAGLSWPAAVDQLLAVLAVICALPRVEQVIPAPGQRGAPPGSIEDVDDKVLRRVRALLAKAESTEHPDESDALTAKAQQLMTRHSIDRAMAESERPSGSAPVARRLWLDNPYIDAKALLVDVVARANNCKAIQAPAWGFVSIIGHSGDLDLVELLTTSLLVQATRAMSHAGTQLNRCGESRTRSFRRSFLVAYAGRIGERLAESAQNAEAAYDGDHGGALVPVLAARRRAVDDTVTELFPNLVQRRLTASNSAGWGAGRAAADLASIDVREALRS